MRPDKPLELEGGFKKGFLNYKVVDLNLRDQLGLNPMKQVKANIKKNSENRALISNVKLETTDDARVTIGRRKKTVETTNSIYFKPSQGIKRKTPEFIKEQRK